MSVKQPFGKILVQRNFLEKKQLEIFTNEPKPSGAPIAYTEQNSQLYLTISVGIGMRKNDTFSKLYAELWGEYHDWVLENWKCEDLGYYLRVTD